MDQQQACFPETLTESEKWGQTIFAANANSPGEIRSSEILLDLT
jgi:hypothetical protein